jgi:hypothetical protein
VPPGLAHHHRLALPQKLLLNCFRDIRRLAHDLGGAPAVMGQGERAVAAIPSKNLSTRWVPGDSPPRCRTTPHIAGVLELIEWARSPEAERVS